MTVVLESTIKRYIGDTIDAKPTSVPVGSTYYDRQTQILYITYDGTNWVVKDARQYDDTDKLAVSLYGKSSAAGDKPVLLDSNGRVQIVTGTRVSGTPSMNNGVQFIYGPGETVQAPLAVTPMRHSGSALEVQRNNSVETLLASAARTTAATADLVNYNHRGILLVIDVTARAVATTLTPKLTLKTPVANTYDIDFWTVAAAIDTANGTYAYLFYPAETPAAITFTEEINVTLPRDFRLTVTPSDANSVTYSVGVYYLL